MTAALNTMTTAIAENHQRQTTGTSQQVCPNLEVDHSIVIIKGMVFHHYTRDKNEIRHAPCAYTRWFRHGAASETVKPPQRLLGKMLPRTTLQHIAGIEICRSAEQGLGGSAVH